MISKKMKSNTDLIDQIIKLFEDWYHQIVIIPLAQYAFHCYQSYGTPPELFIQEHERRNIKRKYFDMFIELVFKEDEITK